MSALIITPAYTDICRELRAAILASGLPVLPAFEHSDLPRARSMLISQALTSAADRLILVDADIVPTGEQLSLLATTPLVHYTQAVTGLYPTRDGKRWAVHARDPAAAERGDESFEAEWAGLGFCAISTESLRRLGRALPTITGEGGGWKPYCVPFVEEEEETVTYYPDDRVLWMHLARRAGCGLLALSTLKVGHLARAVLRAPLG